jgi:hypothetical protein
MSWTLFSVKYESGDKQPSLKYLRATFLSIVQSSGQECKIVLDALDECSTQDAVLEWILFLRLELTNLSLLVISRDETLMESGMRDWLGEEGFATFQNDIMNLDIIAYVQNSLHAGRSFERRLLDLGANINMKGGDRKACGGSALHAAVRNWIRRLVRIAKKSDA